MTDTPLIPKVPEKLIAAAESGELVLMIGAGVSKLLGYPSWDEMAERTLGQILKHGLIDYAEYLSLSQMQCRQKLTIAFDIAADKQFELKYTEIFEQTGIISGMDGLYDALYSMGGVFLTTNYDECLDKVVNKLTPLTGGSLETNSLTPKNASIFFQKEDLNERNLNLSGAILHLHGSIKVPSSMIVTTRQYLEHYQHHFVTKFLKQLFDKKVVLFIGYGLQEQEILEYVIQKRSAQQESKPDQEVKHFWLYPRLSRDRAAFKHLEKYYSRHCNVNLIDFDIDKIGHSQLGAIIFDWAKKLKIQPLNFNKEAKETIDRILKKQ